MDKPAVQKVDGKTGGGKRRQDFTVEMLITVQKDHKENTEEQFLEQAYIDAVICQRRFLQIPGGAVTDGLE